MLKLVDLKKSFAGTKVLSNVSFEIEPGESFAIFGKSGSGKTTILRIIAGLLQPDEGEVYINGNHFNNIPAYLRPIGFQFQDYALFPNLNVEQNLKYPLKYAKNTNLNNGMFLEIIKQLEIEHILDRRIFKLSGGEQQRVALGRALIRAISTNGLLLLDEPVSALDDALRENARIIIKESQKKFNLTTLFITHDIRDVIIMADRMGILEDHKIQQIGSIEDVSQNPLTENVALSFGFKYLGKYSIKYDNNRYYLNYNNNKIELKNFNLKDWQQSGDLKCYIPEKYISIENHENGCISGIVYNVNYSINGTHILVKIKNKGTFIDLDINDKYSISVGSKIYLNINWNKAFFFR